MPPERRTACSWWASPREGHRHRRRLFFGSSDAQLFKLVCVFLCGCLFFSFLFDGRAVQYDDERERQRGRVRRRKETIGERDDGGGVSESPRRAQRAGEVRASERRIGEILYQFCRLTLCQIQRTEGGSGSADDEENLGWKRITGTTTC